MTAVLGSAGSTIAEDLYLEVIPEFVFKDDVDSSKYLVVLERRSIVWQPSAIPPQMQELIIADLVMILLQFCSFLLLKFIFCITRRKIAV
jgi:hypothetical protein